MNHRDFRYLTAEQKITFLKLKHTVEVWAELFYCGSKQYVSMKSHTEVISRIEIALIKSLFWWYKFVVFGSNSNLYF